MYRKKATFLTFNSLTALPKVCRYPNSHSSMKFLTLLRNFGIATERSDFDNPSWTNEEYSINYEQNPNGFYRNDNGQDGNWNLEGNNGDFLENPDGFYGENGIGNGVYQQNPTRVYEKNPIYEIQQSPVEENVIFGTNSDNNNSCHASRKGFQQNPDMRIGNLMSRNDFRQTSVGQNANSGRGCSESRQPNLVTIHQRQGGEIGNFTNDCPGEDNGNEFEQRSNWRNVNFSDGISVETQQNPILQVSGLSDGYGGVSQQSATSHNVGNLGTPLQNSQNYDAGRPGSFPQMQDNSYAGDAGINQQTLSVVSKGNDKSTGHDGYMNLTGPIEELDHYVKEGKLDEAMKILEVLEKQDIAVDLPRYLALMRVCGKDGSVEEAIYIHGHLMRSIPNVEASTYNKILEMYVECGSVVDAYSVFEQMPERNLTSWDTLISGLAKNGHGEAALDLFLEFKELGLKPDGQIYLGVFNACAALLDTNEGMLHFKAISKDYGIVPSMQHYVSVVDMLASTGYMDEALEFIEKMPVQPSVEVWETLMHLSRVQGDMELGDRCAEFVDLLDESRLNEKSRAGLITVTDSNLSKETEKKKFEAQNPPGVRSHVHEYRAGDRSDPDSEKLYALLLGLKHQMKEAGYIPETKVVLHDIDQESKEQAVMGHSERLAVAKGLLSTTARSPLRVIKNLRFCLDCHNAMKIISKLVGRELIMRDAKRFHHFKDGVCSCRDYW